MHSDDTTTGLHSGMHLPVCALPQFWVTKRWILLRRAQFVFEYFWQDPGCGCTVSGPTTEHVVCMMICLPVCSMR